MCSPGPWQVDSHEFSAYIAGQEDKIFSAFQELDADHTGEVDDHELLMALKKLGHNIKPDDADRMIKLLDKDGNGQIDLDEFRRFVVLLPQNQLSGGGIITNWIDSADWATGIEYRLSMTPPQQWRDRLIAGGVAGAVSRTTVAPLERLRTMMMADPANISLPGTIRKMWADGGVRGLFKGNLATVTKVIPQCAIQMSVYDYVKDKLQAKHPDDKLNNVERLTAGVAAGAASTISTYPMENLRTHVSLGRKGGYLKILNDIYCSRGLVSGVYGGFGPCMVNTVTTTGLGFLSYEIGCDLYRKYGMEKPRAPTPGERGFIAGGGAIAVMAATMPLEVVTRRMQVQGSPGHPVKYKSMADCFAVMAREEGLGSFWRGTVSSWMKVVPSIAIVRFMYEVMNSFQGSSGIRGYRTSPPNKASQQATAS
mmetsp:Transcript_9066/g.27222  ORF Transcript_9066/g.27222 Transcript_9066/m.27222 type:complete len:424 (+) Transcript_9066:234-1505(+)